MGQAYRFSIPWPSESFSCAGATDVELAKNLGCKAILLQPDKSLLTEKGLEDTCVLATTDWDRVAEFLFAGERTAEVCRKTKETDIRIRVG